MAHSDRHTGRATAAALFLMATAVLACYWPALTNRFVIYDDPEYVTENGPVLAGLTRDSIGWAFTTAHEGNWHPLTWLSHMVDVTIYGLNPAGHHLTSLILHAAATLCLFLGLRRMTGAFWKSAAVALLFALHPLHVESVAWVAERKDVLSALFFFLALLAWHRYTRRPGSGPYALLLLLFAAGLMAKQMVITLPFVLLLLDWWPLGRLGKDVPLQKLLREKLPLFVLALGGALVTFLTHQSHEAVASLAPRALLEHAAHALVASAAYLGKMLLPVGLAVFYPYDPGFPPPLALAAAAFVFVATTGAALLWRRRCPWLIFGWLWYLVTLLPVSGVVRIGAMTMADRYTYLPLVGPFIAIVWGAGALAEKWPKTRPFLVATFALILILLGSATLRQTRHWHDSITLFSHAVSVTPDNWLAWNNLGVAYVLQEEGGNLNISRSLAPPPSDPRLSLVRAMEAFREAVRIRPEYESAHCNLGLALLKLGDREGALAEYRILQHLDPKLARRLEGALSRQ